MAARECPGDRTCGGHGAGLACLVPDMPDRKGTKEAVRIGLPFERPIVELEVKIGELQSLSESTGMNLNGELKPLQRKLDRMRREIYAGLSPYDTVQVARHPLRPQQRHRDHHGRYTGTCAVFQYFDR